MAKIIVANHRNFIVGVTAGLLKLGAVEKETTRTNRRIFNMPTRAGNLVVMIDTNRSEVHSVFSRFDDFEKAKELFPRLCYWNPKYNFHGLDRANSIEEALNHFKYVQ